MANSLVSPGIQVSVIDESNYASNAQGTVPLIVMATAQDKTNPSGSLATGTSKASAGTLYNVGDQRSLSNLFGLPTFPTDASGNRIYGSELAEYGLYAAHNILGTISSAYVIRADINLSELEGTEARPSTPASSGTLWVDSDNSEWGIFEWNAVTQSFTHRTTTFLYDTTNLDGDMPKASYGKIGDYAVVGYDNPDNPVYYKNHLNDWVLVGSSDWAKSAFPTVQGTIANVTNISPGDTIIINDSDPIASTGTTAAGFVNDINLIGIPGVVAELIDGKVTLFADSTAKSDGVVADGKIYIHNDNGTILTKLGITADTYNIPTVQFSKHSNVPQWKPSSAVPRPTGSIWVKTTSFNHGAKLLTYRRNSVSNTWDTLANPLYANDYDANYNLDPTRGGLGIARNSIYTQYDVLEDGSLSFRVLIRLQSGTTSITGSTNTNPTATNSFTIKASQVGSNSLTGLYTITIPSSPNNTITKVAELISLADIPNITATVTSAGNLNITHTAGGVIILNNTSGTPLTTMGITANTAANIRTGNNDELIVSNWVTPTHPAIVKQPEAPTNVPADGALWFYSGANDVDIMINDNNVWKGYRNVEVDARGFDLTMTDPNGPIVSYSQPTVNSLGNTLVYGDLWVDTSDFDNYPKIWRWESKASVDQWVSLNVADATIENGVVFADARWDGDGLANVLTDDLPLITDLLLNDSVDLDAPDADLYPTGCLLFNTRRSSNNVKKYVANYFTQDNFPLGSLPEVSATWQSYSGKAYNNVPFFGRKAVRNVVVSALSQAITDTAELTEEGKNFNLLLCPGYTELLVDLKALNDNRKNTGFVIGEVPMGLSTDQTTVENYLTDTVGSGTTGETAINIVDPYTAVFYPGAATVNAPDGVGQVVIPMSAAVLKTFVLSDQNSEVWFAPAGNTRGSVDVLSIGYVDRMNNNAFVKTGTPQGLRDLLYPNRVNPVIVMPQTGIVNFGNHTRSATNTALDRINVARLTTYLRTVLEQSISRLIFEPNDRHTRDIAKSICESLLNDVLARRGIYDYLVVCDRTNNTNASIDRNELHIDIAIEPVKAVEFIYIPIRLKGTGQIQSGNVTPSTALG